MTKQDLKMLTIERKEAIRDRLFKYDLSVGEGKLLEEEVFDILDQELSNHTQRVREEISQLPDGVDIHGVDYSDLVYRDAVLSIPSLQTNPTKDNAKEA